MAIDTESVAIKPQNDYWHRSVPTINGDVKYQPKAQVRFFIRNDKTGSGEGLYATLVLRPELCRGEFNSHQLACSWYFIKRSKLTSLCPGSGHYTKCYWWHALLWPRLWPSLVKVYMHAFPVCLYVGSDWPTQATNTSVTFLLHITTQLLTTSDNCTTGRGIYTH